MCSSRRSTKSFDTPERAQREAAKPIAEKVRKGHLEIEPMRDTPTAG